LSDVRDIGSFVSNETQAIIRTIKSEPYDMGMLDGAQLRAAFIGMCHDGTELYPLLRYACGNNCDPDLPVITIIKEEMAKTGRLQELLELLALCYYDELDGEINRLNNKGDDGYGPSSDTDFDLLDEIKVIAQQLWPDQVDLLTQVLDNDNLKRLALNQDAVFFHNMPDDKYWSARVRHFTSCKDWRRAWDELCKAERGPLKWRSCGRKLDPFERTEPTYRCHQISTPKLKTLVNSLYNTMALEGQMETWTDDHTQDQFNGNTPGWHVANRRFLVGTLRDEKRTHEFYMWMRLKRHFDRQRDAARRRKKKRARKKMASKSK